MNINEIKEEEIMDKIEDLKNAILISEEQFRSCLIVRSTMGFDEIKPYIIMAQESEILHIIGYSKLRCIQLDITNGCISDEDKQMINDISMCLAHYAIYYAIPELFSKIKPVELSWDIPNEIKDKDYGIDWVSPLKAIIKNQADFAFESFKINQKRSKNERHRKITQVEG